MKARTKISNGEYHVYSPEILIKHLQDVEQTFSSLSEETKQSVNEQKNLAQEMTNISDKITKNSQITTLKITEISENAKNDNQNLTQKLSDQHKESTEEYNNNLEKLAGWIYDNLERQQQKTNDNIKEQIEKEKEFHQLIREQQDKICRLEASYDLAIYRKYIRRFADIQMFIIKELNLLPNADKQTKDFLDDINYQFYKAFEECDVTAVEPQIGSNFIEQAKLIDEEFVEVPTNDDDIVGKVAEIIRPAYKKIDDENDIVVKAKVAVYKKIQPTKLTLENKLTGDNHG